MGSVAACLLLLLCHLCWISSSESVRLQRDRSSSTSERGAPSPDVVSGDHRLPSPEMAVAARAVSPDALVWGGSREPAARAAAKSPRAGRECAEGLRTWCHRRAWRGEEPSAASPTSASASPKVHLDSMVTRLMWRGCGSLAPC